MSGSALNSYTFSYTFLKQHLQSIEQYIVKEWPHVLYLELYSVTDSVTEILIHAKLQDVLYRTAVYISDLGAVQSDNFKYKCVAQEALAVVCSSTLSLGR